MTKRFSWLAIPALGAILVASVARAAAPEPVPVPAPDAAPASPAPSAQPEPAGFRITVPLCRRAEQAADPLAQTAECQQLLKAAKDQAEACRQAFEDGRDDYVLSPACRQAASYR